MLFKRDYDTEKHLSYNEQLRIVGGLEMLGRAQPISKGLLFPNAAYLSLVPSCAMSYMSWRAAFRGYNLIRYGRGRVTTAFLALVYPIYGANIHYFTSSRELVEPFRPESPWYYGMKFALMQKVSNLSILISNIGVCYLFGSAYGTIPLPGKGLHKPSAREVYSEMVLKRLLPYGKGLLITSFATSAFMFAVGIGAYYQSCTLLGALNRKSLGLKEDSEVLPM